MKLSRRSFLAASAATAGLPTTLRATVAPATFRYQNPITNVRVRDCQIIRENGTYFMTGTFPPFWGEGASPGVRIARSLDLKNWSKPQIVLKPAGWFRQLFWAPEVFPHRGRYYLTFNCPIGGNGPIDPRNRDQAVGLAVADNVMGPYRPLTPDKPLVRGNDATLLLDSDGRVYLYHTTEVAGIEGIGCTPVDLGGAKTIGRTLPCISAGREPGWEGGRDVGIEGPSVFKRGSLYYMLYSGWGRGYEVGYATAPSPIGPWVKYRGNPIFGAQDPDWTKDYSGIYTQAKVVPFGQVGHGSPFFGPDGRIWFSCHGIMQKNRGYDLEPHLVITPMTFAADGSLTMHLTWTEQSVHLPSRRDSYWRPSGSPASVSL